MPIQAAIPIGRHDYNERVEEFRDSEYPMLKDHVYLDHAGTTLYARSCIEKFSTDMMSTLYGNPHSFSMASQNSTHMVEQVRLKLLRLFKADPTQFDVVFVANATAGMKLVTEAFSENGGRFWYGYHKDSHTSMVGIREIADQHICFANDKEAETWIHDYGSTVEADEPLRLFAYPAQSNMDGRRLPLDWCRRIRLNKIPHTFTLLDAAGLVSTSPLDMSDSQAAPDFCVLSLYKIFGFPDLGAIIVRKATGSILARRRYFGGGTVEMVVSLKETWHARKEDSLHSQLEDGSLPIHNILALNAAIDVHQRLFGSLDRVSRHCAYLAQTLYDGLSSLKHGNGTSVCKTYAGGPTAFLDPREQGPVVAFNIQNSKGGWVANSEVEKLASIRNISFRTGGLCNPGGIATALNLAPWEMKRNFSAGQRCGNENDIIHGKPTGVIRVSLGAMSTFKDVQAFLRFMAEFFVEKENPIKEEPRPTTPRCGDFYVEALAVYPIKSCSAFKVPPHSTWALTSEGLAWDREWCLVRPGSGTALSQKRYPRMALIKPTIDLDAGLLRVKYIGADISVQPIAVPLSFDPALFESQKTFSASTARVCGDTIVARTYTSEAVTDFFTQALGVDCQLARFPSAGSATSIRHAKAHLQPHQVRQVDKPHPGASPQELASTIIVPRPILLSNESPILVISRSSLNRLNKQIESGGGKAVHAEAFRANIVVAEHGSSMLAAEQPYVEDSWRMLQVGCQLFQILGSCRRCQMVCIDQQTGTREQEPFVTLAKTRRFDGSVFFGQHACHIQAATADLPHTQNPRIAVGDQVIPLVTV